MDNFDLKKYLAEGRLTESTESKWNAIDVSRKAEKELSNKEWNECTAKKLKILTDLNNANKFKKDWDEEKLQGWVDKNYSWEKLTQQFKLNERLSPSQQDRLDSLRDELKSALDPDKNYNYYDGRDEIDIRMDIRKEFGDVIANQIEDGEYEMNFPRDTGVPGFQGPDKLADKEKFGDNRYRVTKSGKMNKQDVDRMKKQYKRGY